MFYFPIEIWIKILKHCSFATIYNLNEIEEFNDIIDMYITEKNFLKKLKINKNKVKEFNKIEKMRYIINNMNRYILIDNSLENVRLFDIIKNWYVCTISTKKDRLLTSLFRNLKNNYYYLSICKKIINYREQNTDNFITHHIFYNNSQDIQNYDNRTDFIILVNMRNNQYGLIKYLDGKWLLGQYIKRTKINIDSCSYDGVFFHYIKLDTRELFYYSVKSIPPYFTSINHPVEKHTGHTIPSITDKKNAQNKKNSLSFYFDFSSLNFNNIRAPYDNR